MNQKSFALALPSVLILLLSGCAKTPKYNAKKLQTIPAKRAQFTQTKNNVTVNVKKLNQLENKELFENYDVFLTEKDPVQPLQITVENNSATGWQLTQNDITLPLESYTSIAKRMSSQAVSRTVTYPGLTGLSAAISAASFPPFIAGLALGSGALMALALPFGITFAGGVIATAALINRKVVITHRTNSIIEKDLKEKTLDSLIIEPVATENVLIFVKKDDLKNKFTLTLQPTTDENDQLVFNVDLNPIKPC